jgi:hypothetical protein
VWFHYRDDLYDKDKPVSAESAKLDLFILHTFGTNPFFQKHQAYLWPVFTMATLAWIASEEWKNSLDIVESVAGQVLKSQYQDYFYAVAFCIGGFDHALAMSRRYRGYYFDSEKPKSVDAALGLPIG